MKSQVQTTTFGSATTLTLHPTRLEQLRAIADQEHCSVAEVIDSFVKSAIEAGRIPDSLPRFEISRAGGAITVSFNGEFEVVWTVATACEVAETIEAAAAGATGTVMLLDPPDPVTIRRQGTGIVLEILATTARVNFRAGLSPNLARDFARILRREAA